MASPRSKYPLEPLLQHRRRQVDGATSELGAAVRGREAAEVVKARASRAQREAEERDAAVRAEEAARLGRGELRAVDLARADAWEVSARSQAERLAEATRSAETGVTRAADAEDGARRELAQRMADRDVVAKDAARFDARTKQRAALAEEEAAEEAFRGGDR